MSILNVDSLPYCVIKIEGYKNNDPSNVATGTGFFYLFKEENRDIPVIVTNKHVVEGLDILVFHFSLVESGKERVFGPSVKIEVNVDGFPFFRHPDPKVDLVCIPVVPISEMFKESGKKIYFQYLDCTMFPPDWMRKRLAAATEVLMIGFPNGLMDDSNNLPISRKGILATPYFTNYRGESNFVVDIAAFGGSSGSPVFAYFSSVSPEADGWGLGAPKAYLIGVLHSGPVFTIKGEISTAPVPVLSSFVKSNVMMHLGYCVRAELVEEMRSLFRGFK